MDHLLAFARQSRKFPTVGEDRLWSALRRNALGVKFRRQHPLPPFIVDFACVRERLVLEVDGPHHDHIREEDAARDEELRSRGWTVVRVSADEAALAPERVVDRLVAQLAHRVVQH